MKNFSLFGFLHQVNDYMNDEDINKSFAEYRRIEHIKESFHARGRKL